MTNVVTLKEEEEHIKCSKEHYLLGHCFMVCLGNFKQYQFISVFYAVTHEKVKKMKLFQTHCPH